jgi:hypothetical protein
MPSAKLAFRVLSSYTQGFYILKEILSKVSIFHFSVMPSQIVNITPEKIWSVICGMCNAPLDKRALSLSILELNINSSKYSWEFHHWLKTNNINTQTFQSLQTKLITAALCYLRPDFNMVEEVLLDDDYFYYNFIELDAVETINYINPIYYIGYWSWMKKPIEASLQIIHPNLDISNIIDIFELNQSSKSIQYEDYWEAAKKSMFNDRVKDMESLWQNTLRTEMLNIIQTIQEYRLPIQMSG